MSQLLTPTEIETENPTVKEDPQTGPTRWVEYLTLAGVLALSATGIFYVVYPDFIPETAADHVTVAEDKVIVTANRPASVSTPTASNKTYKPMFVVKGERQIIKSLEFKILGNPVRDPLSLDMGNGETLLVTNNQINYQYEVPGTYKVRLYQNEGERSNVLYETELIIE